MRLLKDVPDFWRSSGERTFPPHWEHLEYLEQEQLKQLDVTPLVHGRAGSPTFSQAREGVKNRPLQK